MSGVYAGTEVADEEGLTDPKACAVLFPAQHRDLVAGFAGRGVRADRAARAIVVLPDSDVKRPDCTADVGIGTLLTFKAIDTLSNKTKSAGRHRAVGEVAPLVLAPLESVSEFVGAVVDTNREIISSKNACNTRVNEV